MKNPGVWRRSVYALVGVLALLSVLPAQARKRSEKPQATPAVAESRIPSQIVSLTPSGAMCTFRVSGVQVDPPRATAARGAVPVKTDPDKFKKIFNGAIVFQRDNGYRIVPLEKAGDVEADYIEVRRNGNGFGVSSENDSSKAHVYLTDFKVDDLPKKCTKDTTATADTGVEITFEVSKQQPKQAAQLRLELTFLQDLTRAEHNEQQPAGSGAASTDEPSESRRKGKSPSPSTE